MLCFIENDCRYYIKGYCTEYNIGGNIIQGNSKTNCTAFIQSPCPIFYPSNEAYKCKFRIYNIVGNPRVILIDSPVHQPWVHLVTFKYAWPLRPLPTQWNYVLCMRVAVQFRVLRVHFARMKFDWFIWFMHFFNVNKRMKHRWTMGWRESLRTQTHGLRWCIYRWKRYLIEIWKVNFKRSFIIEWLPYICTMYT